MQHRPRDEAPQQRDQCIAYLTGLYPAVSHTFILREITGLRAAGLRVITCSVHRPPATHLIGPEEIEAASATYYLLQEMRSPLVLIAAIGAALARPRRLLHALRKARRSGTRGFRQHARQVIYLVEATVLARHLRRQGATRIHNQLGMASASVSMYAAILAGIPFSLSLHGPDDFFPHERLLLARKIEAADVVACISEFCRNQAERCSSPTEWEKLHLVRCGIDPRRYGMRSGRRDTHSILFVGRLIPVKGVPVLLEAFALLAKHLPEARLTIVGDGPERSTLERKAQELGIRHRVSFTGALSQQDVSARMSDADLFVLPSYDEGLPVVLMEAMASGLPVITTPIAGIPELVQNGVTGRIVSAGDAAGLAGAILAHFGDLEAATTMRYHALTLVLRQHDMWVEGRRLAALLSERQSC